MGKLLNGNAATNSPTVKTKAIANIYSRSDRQVSHWIFIILLFLMLSLQEIICITINPIDLPEPQKQVNPHANNLNYNKIHKRPTNPQLQKHHITLIGTNDIHGTAYPKILSRIDTGERYKYGGIVYMARLIQILREQNDGNLLYLDAGDQFQGGLESSPLISQGEIMSDYFNHMQTEAGAIGNHEFDFGAEFLDKYLKGVEFDVLSANLIDTAAGIKNSNKRLPLRDQQASKVYRFPITKRNDDKGKGSSSSQIRIGVIGLTTIETPRKTSGFVDGLFPLTYKFQDYRNVVLRQAEKLQTQDSVHAIVLVAHVGNECNNNTDYGVWTMKKQQQQEKNSSWQIPCVKNDEMFQLLDSLPEGLIDVVVQGHRHTTSHYFYRGVPIIGTINGGYYFNMIDLPFTVDWENQHIYIDPEDISIEGPIPVCQKIFQKTHKCEYVTEKQLQEDRVGELVRWKFHGKDVYADRVLSEIYERKYGELMREYEFEICENHIEEPFLKNYAQNSSLGNLMTNLLGNGLSEGEYSEIIGHGLQGDRELDFVILNGGGFRTTWYPGVIRYAQLYSMLPFLNVLVRFEIWGRDLKRMMEILQNGEKKYYPSWGLNQIFRRRNNSSIQLQELNIVRGGLFKKNNDPFVEIEKVEDDKKYIGYTLQFLINGGDDFSRVLSEGIQFMNVERYPIYVRDFIQRQLLKLETIDQRSISNPGGVERIVINGSSSGDSQKDC